MKLFETMMDYFDAENLGLLGAVLGEHEVKVRDGVEAAVPEILSAMADRTATVEGRQVLWRELRDTDHGVASSFANQLYYQNSQSLIEAGNHQLSGLIGKTAQLVTDRVSRAADIGSTSARKMVGAVSPLIFASLAAHQKQYNVSPDQWETLFAEQAPTLRQHAIRASTPKKANDTRQKTFANFDTIDLDGAPSLAQGAENALAVGVSSVSSGGVAAGAVGAAAGTLGVAQTLSKNSAYSSHVSKPVAPIDANSYEYRRQARRSRPAFAANPAQSGFGTSGNSGRTAARLTATPVAGAAGLAATNTGTHNQTPTSGSSSVSANGHSASTASGAGATYADQTDQTERADRRDGTNQRLVPDTDDLKREREKERLAKLQTAQNAGDATTNKNGGVGWLLWQLPLLLGTGLAGWFFGGDLLDKIYNGPDSAASSTEIAQADTAGADENNGQLPKASEVGDSFSGDDPMGFNPLRVDGDQSNATENIEAAPDDATSAPAKEASQDNDSAQSPTNSTASGTTADLSSKNAAKPDADSDTPSLSPAPTSLAEPDTPKPSDEPSEADLQGDVDFEIESTLTDLELSLKKIQNANTATKALPNLTKGIDDLEDILKTSSQWTDEEKVLVDLQLQDGRKLFKELQKKAFKKPALKAVMAPLFKRLKGVLKAK